MKNTHVFAIGMFCATIGLGLYSTEAKANRCHQDCFITWRACVRIADNLPEPGRTAELIACNQEKASCNAAADQFCPADPPGLIWEGDKTSQGAVQSNDQAAIKLLES